MALRNPKQSRPARRSLVDDDYAKIMTGSACMASAGAARTAGGQPRVPLHKILISRSATNAEYETRMAEAFAIYREHGTNRVAFGDLFLEEIRVIASDCSPGRECSVYIPSGGAIPLP